MSTHSGLPWQGVRYMAEEIEAAGPTNGAGLVEVDVALEDREALQGASQSPRI